MRLSLIGFPQIAPCNLEIAPDAGRHEVRGILPLRRIANGLPEIDRVFDRHVVNEMPSIGRRAQSARSDAYVRSTASQTRCLPRAL